MKRLWKTLLLCLLLAALLVPWAQAETEHRVVRVACNINKSLYLDEGGGVTGYCKDYLTALAKNCGWELEYVPGSWTDSMQRLLDGEIDLLFPTQMTDKRRETMGFSTIIGGYQPIGLYTRADAALYYDDYAGFDGARVAVSKGTSNEAAMRAYAAKNGFRYTPVYLNTTEEKVQALESGDVDLIVFSTLSDVPGGKVVAMLDYLPFYYCTNIADTALLEELNAGMKELLIRSPALVEQVFTDFMNKNIAFACTREEHEAVVRKGTIRVGLYKETEPMFSVDESGAYHGIYVDLLREIEATTGLTIEIVALDRSEYVYDYLDEGTIDYVLGSSDQALAFNDSDTYVQSDPMMDYYTVAISRSDYRIAGDDAPVFALTTARKYWAPLILADRPEAKIAYFSTAKECLNAVLNGSADLALLNTWEYNYQSKNPRFESLIEWENSRTQASVIMATTKRTDPLICSVINKAIDQITEAARSEYINYNLNRAYTDFDFDDRLYNMKESLILFGCVIVMIALGVSIYTAMRRRNTRELMAKNALLEESNRQLAEADSAKDSFLSRMSHELRTPLNAITGYATELQQCADEDTLSKARAQEDLAAIQRAARYLLAIIGDLLDVQKIEQGKIELTKEEVDAAAFMAEVVEMIRPEAEQKGVQFSYERLSRVNDTYLVDRVRLQQVLFNVLHNAIKFTPAGGSVRMTAEVIDAGERTNTLKLVIADTGIGMSRDFTENYLFHKFAQEYHGNTSPYEGCGIGLAISRELLHLIGGEISCDSVQGSGTTFTIILTLEHIDRRDSAAHKPRVAVPCDLQGVHVLLCEDHPTNREIERRLLEKLGCRVDTAADGLIGCELFAASGVGEIDMILMDVRMPNMDGLDAARTIRAMERPDAATVPIIAVSANVFDEDVRLSMEAGINEHLAKPIDIRLVHDKIKEYCVCSGA